MRFFARLLACMCLMAPSLPLMGQEQDKSADQKSSGSKTSLSPKELAQVQFFESHIRPVLVEHCYVCHSVDSRDIGGGLLLDSRAGWKAGGDNGAAIVPGKPDASLLLKAMKHTDRDLIMPPKESGPKLSDAVIANFETWIRNGAIDPRTEAPKATKKKYDPEAAKQWWAWKARKSQTPPKIPNDSWSRTDIDRFIVATWQREGVQPVADAKRVELIRRLAFDLTGLPPTVPELYDFALSPNPEPLEKLVDRYLDSTAYGERMGRRWLDVARYAESAGKDFNGAYPHAWRYRDYVIDSLNADVPYDQFVVEQIAGDLLPAKTPREKGNHLIATGFLAIGPKSINEQKSRQLATDIADEQIDTLSQAFLGITIACARCHDHKFDPITQQDYTAMAGIFLSTETHFGTQGGVGGRNRSELVELPAEFSAPKAYPSMLPGEYALKQQRLEELRKQQQELFAERARSGGAGNPGPEFLRIQQQRNNLETELSMYAPDGTCKALAMAVNDKPKPDRSMFAFRGRRGQFPGGPGPGQGPGLGGLLRLPQRPGALPPELLVINDSPLFERGDVDKPGERVPRGLPVFLTGAAKVSIPSATSGRLELAEWIADARNPLTARVMVNRVWSWLIGQGLVASVDNFGSTGDLPSHPELLDYLSDQFIKDNWSIKKLVKRIVLSRTYGLSSDYHEDNFAKDPDNRYLWRANVRTLEAEAVRDTILVASGLLDKTRPHGSMISMAGDGVVGGRPNGGRTGGLSEEQIAKAVANYRSIYLPLPRNLLPDALELFDFPDNSMVHGSRETTLVPGQALFWLNSQAVDRAAQKIAQRVLPELNWLTDKSKASSAQNSWGPDSDATEKYPRQKREVDTAQTFEHITLLVLSRSPLDDETRAVENFVKDQAQAGVSAENVWTSVCRALLSSADFRRLR